MQMILLGYYYTIQIQRDTGARAHYCAPTKQKHTAKKEPNRNIMGNDSLFILVLFPLVPMLFLLIIMVFYHKSHSRYLSGKLN